MKRKARMQSKTPPAYNQHNRSSNSQLYKLENTIRYTQAGVTQTKHSACFLANNAVYQNDCHRHPAPLVPLRESRSRLRNGYIQLTQCQESAEHSDERLQLRRACQRQLRAIIPLQVRHTNQKEIVAVGSWAVVIVNMASNATDA